MPVLTLLLWLSAFCFGSEVLISTGEVFDKEGKEKKFTYERYQKRDGEKLIDRAVYKDLEGEVLTEETMETLNGNLVRYEIGQKQLKQRAWIEVDDKNVTFNLKKYRKNNYPQTSKKPENFVVGLQIVPTIQNNWEALLKGDEVEISLGVWHRQEAIRFDLSKESDDGKTFVVKMNPASMFIRAVVDPIYFSFEKGTKNLESYKGRTTPKIKKGRSYMDFDGLTRYKVVGTLPDVKMAPKKDVKNIKKK